MSKNYTFLLNDINNSLYFSCCNCAKPFIVIPHNAYYPLKPHAIYNMQYICIFTMNKHGSSQNPCIIRFMHYCCMYYNNLTVSPVYHIAAVLAGPVNFVD
jgi:hypothetical protein